MRLLHKEIANTKL